MVPPVLAFYFFFSPTHFFSLYCNKNRENRIPKHLKLELLTVRMSLTHASVFINVCVSLYFCSTSTSSSVWLDCVSEGTNIRLLSLCNQALHSWAEQYSSSHPTHCPCSSLVTIPHLCACSYLSPTRPWHKRCGENHCIFRSFFCNIVPEWIQVWHGVTGAFPKHLNMWLVISHHKFPTLFFHFR